MAMVVSLNDETIKHPLKSSLVLNVKIPNQIPNENNQIARLARAAPTYKFKNFIIQQITTPSSDLIKILTNDAVNEIYRPFRQRRLNIESKKRPETNFKPILPDTN